tara:strand:- start:229 stop:429 length:201 start_codon:yes stop_codon:yes gene_type:complete
MNVGDLVRVKRDDTDIRGRNAGMILTFDTHHPDSSAVMIRIARVLWPDGPGWIDLERIEKLRLDEI